jgi:hypothetical protein
MHSCRSFLLSVLLAAGFSAAFGQNEISDPGARRICAGVKDVKFPAEDRPTAAEAKALGACSSIDAYFGFGMSADAVRARKCAYAEMDRGATQLLAGKAILMMVYANGKGAQRNFDLALNLACSLGDAPGDAAGRVYQLERLRQSNFAGDNFSVCDHSGGRELYEQCAILQERFDKAEREQKFGELISQWTPAQKRAFRLFRAEAERFYQVQAANGVNLEGTFEVQERAFLENGLLAALEQFERGELPRYSADEFSRAEAAESAAYQRTQTGNVARWGTVSRAGVRKSEEEWRRYLSAWISFGKRKYPAVSEQNWKAWLQQERLVMLNKFLN